MSLRLRLALSRALLCGLVLPAACLTAAPVAAQKQLAPDNSVMTYRLPGTWQIRETEYRFEVPSGGLMGKAPGANLIYREIDRASGKEIWRGTLTPYVSEGVMRGEARPLSEAQSPVGYSDSPRKQIRAWVDDRGRLWMDNYNATSDGQTYARVPTSPPQAALAAWKGKWRTSRGVLEIREEGENFVGWILKEDGSTRERVAFKAEAKQANGAWDSEYDTQGTWQKKLVGYGDIEFTLSADGQSFTGWYSTLTGMMGLERREWTGQRIDRPEPSTSPAGLDATAERLLGNWYTPFGPLEMTRRTDGASTQVGGHLNDGEGRKYFVFYKPGSGTIQIRDAERSDTTAVGFRIATDGSSFDVEGTRSGLLGAWRATRSDPDQTRSQPTTEQATLLRVLEGRWRERDGDVFWRFPVPTQNGAVDATTWRSQDGEGAAKATSFGPAQDGRTLVGKLPNGVRVMIERQPIGEVHLIRPAQNGAPFQATELVKAPEAAPAPVPSQPAPTQPAPPPSQPAPQEPAPQTPPAPAPAAFKPLNRVDVRVDRVLVARGYPTHQVHAFITVKNTSAGPQYFTSGYLKATLADADGMSWERSQPYRASGEPAELFASTPVIQPGGELKVRYVFLSEADARLTSLTLSEGAKRAEFPVGAM